MLLPAPCFLSSLGSDCCRSSTASTGVGQHWREAPLAHVPATGISAQPSCCRACLAEQLPNLLCLCWGEAQLLWGSEQPQAAFAGSQGLVMPRPQWGSCSIYGTHPTQHSCPASLPHPAPGQRQLPKGAACSQDPTILPVQVCAGETRSCSCRQPVCLRQLLQLLGIGSLTSFACSYLPAYFRFSSPAIFIFLYF